MKKLTALLMAALMLVTLLASCGGGAKYVILEDNFGAEDYAIGFRKDDYALAAKVQEILDEMGKDGTAKTISEKWFGRDAFKTDGAFPREMKTVEGDNSLQYILDKGTLILGLDENFPPMGFRDSENGEIIGFDIDLATEVCKRLGVELKVQPIDWNAKEMELDGKNIDCIWNGMSVTPERTESMFLSKPYIANTQAIIVAADSPIKTRADLAGKKVALQQGSSALDAVKADEATYNAILNGATEAEDDNGEIVEFADNITAYMDLKAGRVDAFVVDSIMGGYIIKNN